MCFSKSLLRVISQYLAAEGDKLAVPLVSYNDFERALHKAHSSVGTDELERFVQWTEEFGQEG